jgi:menaquinone-dependent protoporphyrinogen oxidase
MSAYGSRCARSVLLHREIGATPDAHFETRPDYQSGIATKELSMKPLILIAYGTKHGSTREVAEVLSEALGEHGIEAEALPAGEVHEVAPYAGVVVGGSLYMGRWHPESLAFLRRHAEALATLPLAVFALGPRTLDPAEVDQSMEQLGHALAKVPQVDPYAVAIFGGVVDPEKLRFPLSKLPASDARDWARIRAWAGELAAAFDYGKPATITGDVRRELQQSPR